MSIVNSFGIYPDSIEHAWEQAQDFLESIGLSCEIDQLEDAINESDLRDIIEDDATNDIIEFIFSTTEDIVIDKYPSLDVEYHINGYDSDISLSDEGITRCISALIDAGLRDDPYHKGKCKGSILMRFLATDMIGELTPDEIEEMVQDKDVFLDFLTSIEHNETVYRYDSVEELGEDNSDNGCREDDDTNESFGEFLLTCYPGHSHEAYFQFSDGSIASINLIEEGK